VDNTLTADEGNLDAQLLKGQLLLAEGKPEEALATVRGAVNAYPRSAEAQFLLGRLYAARGDVAAAESAFREVLSINPRVAAAQAELARLQLSAGNTSASLKSAEEAARNDPGSLSTRLTLVRSLLASQDVSRARSPHFELRRSSYPLQNRSKRSDRNGIRVAEVSSDGRPLNRHELIILPERDPQFSQLSEDAAKSCSSSRPTSVPEHVAHRIARDRMARDYQK
jgi:tetratricopeptide (TPR) repeat protein